MEFKSNWGKVWTYALVLGIALLGGSIAFMLSDEKRDMDADAFYYVSGMNKSTMSGVRGYILAMPDGVDKTNLMKMTDSVHIVTRRAEVMELDSIRRSDIDSTTTATGIIITDVKFQNNKYVMTIEGIDSSQEQCFQTNLLMNAIEHGAVDVTNEICIPAPN